jgi:hypothetical protein
VFERHMCLPLSSDLLTPRDSSLSRGVAM